MVTGVVQEQDGGGPPVIVFLIQNSNEVVKPEEKVISISVHLAKGEVNSSILIPSDQARQAWCHLFHDGIVLLALEDPGPPAKIGLVHEGLVNVEVPFARCEYLQKSFSESVTEHLDRVGVGVGATQKQLLEDHLALFLGDCLDKLFGVFLPGDHFD